MTIRVGLDEDGKLDSFQASAPGSVFVERLDDGEWVIRIDGHRITLATHMNRRISSDYFKPASTE